MTRLGNLGRIAPLAASCGWLALSALTIPQNRQAEPTVDFGRDILPILSDRCFKCHGPDEGSRAAGLRLDTSEGAFADRGGKWAIVPGKPENSLLLLRINHPDAPMPPRASGKSLSDAEKQLIRRWIEGGAKYGKLWSFEPLPKTVPVPAAGDRWAKDDLDRFVFAKLQSEGLKPAQEAPRWRWLRRATLDLTGLPPTEEDIDAFDADKRPDAYERVVDRLLASTAYGERMAAEWLDAARYSDSYGYQSDLLMPSWPYRDWVVRAYNENLPYDQFLTDQVAGDRRPNPTRDQILATAFNRLHRQSNEGGSIAEEYKTEYAADRVDTFGTAFLGLTLGCARCHDHKFDPITQKEYYGLYAFFNSIKEFGLLLSTEIVPTPSLLLPTPSEEGRIRDFDEREASARTKLVAARNSAKLRFVPWRTQNPVLTQIPGIVHRFTLDQDGGRFADAAGGQVVGAPIGKPTPVTGVRGKGLKFDGESGVVFPGLPARERSEPFTWSFWLRDPRRKEAAVVLHRTGGTDVGFCGFDLTIEDGFLTARVMRHWPGNAVAVRTIARIPSSKWTHIAWTWDGQGRAAGLKLYVEGTAVETETLNDRIWKRINVYGDLGASGGNWSFAQRFRDKGFKDGELDEVAFASRSLSPLEIGLLIGKEGTPKQLEDYYVETVDDEVKVAAEAVRAIQKERSIFEDGISEISVMEEADPPIQAYVLARGEYDAPKSEANRVSRHLPKALGGAPAKDRLDLAKWATRSDHPLTARVAVNRLWQMLFGVGMVETSENLGIQGARPSHPELLDFLSRQFVDSGWDVKLLLRRIVLSATYRQDSSQRATRDPDQQNRRLSRGPSGRLSAEMIRDAVLFAAGLLNPKIGGPPVNPYQPAGLWQEFNTMTPGFVQSKGPDLYRRSLYSTWKRTTPVPSMLTFDANARESCMTRRPITNTPLQALVLLNDVQYVEAARVLAEVALKASNRDEARIESAFRRLAGRSPSRKESAILQQTLDEQRLAFRQNITRASRLIRIGERPPDPALRPSELAAMTVTVQTILNSDMVIWKR